MKPQTNNLINLESPAETNADFLFKDIPSERNAHVL